MRSAQGLLTVLRNTHSFSSLESSVGYWPIVSNNLEKMSSQVASVLTKMRLTGMQTNTHIALYIEIITQSA